jgi:hypothetical protein
MASQQEIDQLVDTFMKDLDDEAKQDVIDRLEDTQPKAAEILKNAWKVQKTSGKIDQIVNRVSDKIDNI